MMDQDIAAEVLGEDFEGWMFDAQSLGVFLPGECPTTGRCRKKFIWSEDTDEIIRGAEEDFRFSPKVSLYVGTIWAVTRALRHTFALVSCYLAPC